MSRAGAQRNVLIALDLGGVRPRTEETAACPLCGKNLYCAGQTAPRPQEAERHPMITPGIRDLGEVLLGVMIGFAIASLFITGRPSDTSTAVDFDHECEIDKPKLRIVR